MNVSTTLQMKKNYLAFLFGFHFCLWPRSLPLLGNHLPRRKLPLEDGVVRRPLHELVRHLRPDAQVLRVRGVEGGVGGGVGVGGHWMICVVVVGGGDGVVGGRGGGVAVLLHRVEGVGDVALLQRHRGNGGCRQEGGYWRGKLAGGKNWRWGNLVAMW